MFASSARSAGADSGSSGSGVSVGTGVSVGSFSSAAGISLGFGFLSVVLSDVSANKSLMTGILSAFFIIPYVTPPPPTTPARMIAAALRPACFTAVPAAVFAAFSAIAAGCLVQIQMHFLYFCTLNTVRCGAGSSEVLNVMRPVLQLPLMWIC